MNAPAEIIRRICASCAIGDMIEGNPTCGLCRLHEFVKALKYHHEGGLPIEKAVKQAEREYRLHPAGADKRKYRRAFPVQDVF